MAGAHPTAEGEDAEEEARAGLCGRTLDSSLTVTDEKGSCLVGMRQRRLAQVREPVGWSDREALTVVPIIITKGLWLPGPL